MGVALILLLFSGSVVFVWGKRLLLFSAKLLLTGLLRFYFCSENVHIFKDGLVWLGDKNLTSMPQWNVWSRFSYLFSSFFYIG